MDLTVTCKGHRDLFNKEPPLFKFHCCLILTLSSHSCLRWIILCFFLPFHFCVHDSTWFLVWILFSFVWFALFLFCCLSVSFLLSFGLSEDDAYVDKLPTFERHFDSFAGTVTIRSERGKGHGLGKGLEECSICLIFFTQSAIDIEG